MFTSSWTSSASEPPSRKKKAAAVTYGDGIEQEIRVPENLGDVAEARVNEIYVNVGDSIKVDQVLMEIETDKFVMKILSNHACGVVAIHVRVGDKVQAGSVVLALLVIGRMSKSPAVSVEKVAKAPVLLAHRATKFENPAEQKQEAAGVLEVLTKRYGALIRPDVAGVVGYLKKSSFLWVTTDTFVLLFDVETGLLWDAHFKQEKFSGPAAPKQPSTPVVAKKIATSWGTTFASSTPPPAQPAATPKMSIATALQQIQQAKNHGTWRLPLRTEIVNLAQRPDSPYRQGSAFKLFSKAFWLAKEGTINLAEDDSPNSKNDKTRSLGVALKTRLESQFPETDASLLAVNDVFKNNLTAFALHGAKQGWTVHDVFDTQAVVDYLQPLKSTANLLTQFQSIDTRSAPLPPLDAAQFTDLHKGLWEFWGLNAQGLQQLGVRARNPAADVRDCNVAIDFGTSSTVVAYDDNGSHKLLHIGVTDWSQAIKTAHYENPTVLEFVDFAAMLTPWHSEAYRPGVLWDDVRCSHEALHNFRNNETKPEVVASVLTKIKQWALREGNGTRLRITDQTHRDERELDALTLRQPVKGRPLEVSATDPFDPVELYAWFLGLTINWRGRGLFLRYYMTFPVAYQKEVKEKVLASFRRGLQRSLPASLIGQPEFEQFTVEERASEPAAYAATALPCLGIEPTAEGVAYAVFDFGGGTTDFDFGYYRLPTETEADDAGWESVFEHFGSGGDAFLGGENLLEHLAYRTFCHNIEVCRSHKITFIQPLDAQDFPGSERFLERSQAAATNTLMLMARLRPFWETGIASNKTGIEKIDLLGRDGKKLPCELLIPLEALNQFLQERIEIGVRNFYAALKKAFANQPPDQVQVLLAGNASRSSIVQGFFGLLGAAKPPATLVDGAAARVRRAATPALGDEAANPLAALQRRADEFVAGLFGQQPPVFIVHPPLAADESDVYRPTGKTGVALGLLRLCPGSPTLVIHQAERNQMGDAPFLHYIGRIRLGKFHVCLPQGAPYQQWVELGPVRERVFVLVHSQEPRASLGEMKEGDIGLQQKRLDLAGNTTGLRVYGRAVSPHEIDLCTAASAVAAAAGQIENLRRIKLG